MDDPGGEDVPTEVREALLNIRVRVEPRLPLLAVSIAESYASHFDEYARLLPEAKDQVVQSAFANLLGLHAEISPDSPLTPGFDTAAFERAGAVRMRMGVSIDTLMRSFNIWGQRTWDFFRDEVDTADPHQVAALLYISQRIFWHVEIGAASMARGYMREATASWSDREITRFAMVDAMVTGRLDHAELERSGMLRELAPAYRVVVAVGKGSKVSVTDRSTQLVREVTKALAVAVPGTRSLVGVRQGELYVLWPVWPEARSSLLSALEALNLALPDLALGVGRPSTNLDTVAISYEEARASAYLAHALQADHAQFFENLELERVLANDLELRRLSQRILQPLRDYDRRKDSELVTTLQAFVGAGSNVAEAAKSVFVHPNTVVYRLKRIAEVSGQDPRDPHGLLTLSLSLLVSRLGSSPQRVHTTAETEAQ